MHLHERFLADIAAERRRLSRRRLVGNSAKLAGGGALALSAVGTSGLLSAASAQELESDVDVVNYALTLELLENAYYRDGLPLFPELAQETDGFGFSIADNIAIIGSHEAEHVAALTQTVLDLGGTPVEEQAYNFEDAYADADSFLATAQVFENLGVSAYDGAGQFITDPALLTTAGTIVAVEARHASYLNLINDESPYPDTYETPLSPEEVLEAAAPFLATEGAPEATPEGS